MRTLAHLQPWEESSVSGEVTASWVQIQTQVAWRGDRTISR